MDNLKDLFEAKTSTEKDSVYVITIDYAFRLESGYEVKFVTDDYELAKEKFAELVKFEKESSWIDELDEEDNLIIDTDTDTSFECYLLGSYSEYHTNIHLKKYDVTRRKS